MVIGEGKVVHRLIQASRLITDIMELNCSLCHTSTDVDIFLAVSTVEVEFTVNRFVQTIRD
jgi:hypothetical protein